MKKIGVGVVGLGKRGISLIPTIIFTGDADVVAVCDLYGDRVEDGCRLVEENGGAAPTGYTDYHKLIDDPKVEAVFVSTAWESHVEIAVACMKAGKAVSMEVGGAYNVEDCWTLVKAYEETGTPFMLMENCCYDEFELQTTALVRAGKLGRVVHCHGAYSHDLRDEVSGGNVDRHYRLRNYRNRNCENYPTHELGPIAKILNINRGNRLVSLVSVASCAEGIKEFVDSGKCRDKEIDGAGFKQGDIVSTVITCAGGETITLTLDTTLPKYYSREFTVRGTKGLAQAEAEMINIEGDCNTHEYWENVKNKEKYSAYVPDCWKNITPEQRKAGHGGMDYIEFKEWLGALRDGREMPVDVYDAAAWMCVTALSEASVAQAGAVQMFPDFTCGKWLLREKRDVIDLPRPEDK